jgi:hypothetical protein
MQLVVIICTCTCKCKAVPLHTMEAPGRKGHTYSSYSFLTLALDWGEWSASRSSCTLPLGKGPLGTHWIGGWVGPEPVWTQRLEGKSFTPARDQTPVILSAIRHYTEQATPAPACICIYTLLPYSVTSLATVFRMKCVCILYVSYLKKCAENIFNMKEYTSLSNSKNWWICNHPTRILEN